MAQDAFFSSGMELGSFVTSSVLLLRKSWHVIAGAHEGIITNVGEGISWKVYREPGSDLTIIAFEVTQDSSNLQVDLVLSNALREKNFHHLDFLCTKKAPDFSVNSTAISLLYVNYEKLDQLKSKINNSTPLIVTGYGLGGSVASLFTISLLDSRGSGKNRPLCITFGSSLIGDKKLQQAISRGPIWNSCFLHVMSLKDPLPRLFITSHSSSAAALTPQTNPYMPFGTFLFCSDVSSTCFENPESVLELLSSINDQNQGFQPNDYGNIVENLYRKAICKDFTPLGQDLTQLTDSLRASICLQLWAALGLTSDMQQQQQHPNIDINALVTKLEKLEKKIIYQKSVRFNPFKKLNLMKIEMAKLEWYVKYSRVRNIAYYDNYKERQTIHDYDVGQPYRILANYWKGMVEEAKLKPQKASAPFRKSWLYAGTSYRRMIEPLDIAEYYREGGKDYVTKGRSEHYVLLEEWFMNEMTKSNQEAILRIENSYFWACVEKALLSRHPSTLENEMEYLTIESDEENDEAISGMGSCFWASVDQLLLSSKELNIVEENEENLNTNKNNDKENSCFEEPVNASLLSRQGSMVVKEKGENYVNGFGSSVDEALLSRQESIAIKEKEENLNRTRMRNVELILNIDSCFWAYVEEALLLCKELENVQSSVTEKEEATTKLRKIEEYVYGSLKKYEVSPQIFLQKSSYMKWWTKYKGISGNAALASFMSNPHHYRQYAKGTYFFP